ncbi:hypothetical protein C8Q79DRAFT_1007179 [Trametes meyenii]|nr:hypothetical protein C8Q79DRAFT_1007179 [Trametes meyenii]
MLLSKPSGISVHLPPALYVSGHWVEGKVELNLEQLQQDNIQEVHVKLRGYAFTSYVINTTVMVERVPLVPDEASQSLWSRGSAQYPSGSRTVRVPFRLEVPLDAPPSFKYSSLMKNGSGSIRYAVTAVGVRPGALHVNRRARVTLALVPKDLVGLSVRERLSALGDGQISQWRTESKEEKIRRGLWGDYSTVQVQLSIPDEPVLPLFTPVPVIIKVQSTTPPSAHRKAEGSNSDKPVFPPVPDAYNKLEFKLERKSFVSAQKIYHEKSVSDVVVFSKQSSAVVNADVPEKEWVPLDSGSSKGSWVQRAMFKTTIRLDCPPSFAIDSVKCEYRLVVQVPFPGVGNNVEVVMPVTVTSGIDVPIIRDRSGAPASEALTEFLDLPPDYWHDDNDADWEDSKKG